MSKITEQQRAEAQRLLKTGLNSKEVAKKLKGITKYQVAGIYANMSAKRNANTPAKKSTPSRSLNKSYTATPTQNWNGKALLSNFVATIPAARMNNKVKTAVKNLYSAIA